MEKPEEMGAFFDARADGYDAHMRGYVFTEEEFNRFYGAVAALISETSASLQILDLGCGTGLELAFVFDRIPNARITGVDVSAKMLALLRRPGLWISNRTGRRTGPRFGTRWCISRSVDRVKRE